MGGYLGDYPGVASLADREAYLANCPDPNLILRIGELGGDELVRFGSKGLGALSKRVAK